MAKTTLDEWNHLKIRGEVIYREDFDSPGMAPSSQIWILYQDPFGFKVVVHRAVVANVLDIVETRIQTIKNGAAFHTDSNKCPEFPGKLIMMAEIPSGFGLNVVKRYIPPSPTN